MKLPKFALFHVGHDAFLQGNACVGQSLGSGVYATRTIAADKLAANESGKGRPDSQTRSIHMTVADVLGTGELIGRGRLTLDRRAAQSEHDAQAEQRQHPNDTESKHDQEWRDERLSKNQQEKSKAGGTINEIEYDGMANKHGRQVQDERVRWFEAPDHN